MAQPEGQSGATPGTVSVVLLAGLWGVVTCAISVMAALRSLLREGGWDASDRYVLAFVVVSLMFFFGLLSLGSSLQRSRSEQRWLGPSLGVCVLLLALWLVGGDAAGLVFFGPPFLLLSVAVLVS